MKIINLFCLVVFFVLINMSIGADSGPITMREDANITLDGGFIYKLQGSGMWNPVAYGAIPNDGIDDAEAIQDAIDAAEAAGGGIVIYPPGRFDLNTSQSTSYNSTFLELGDNVSHVGFGRGVTVLRVMDSYRTAWRGTCIFGDLRGTGAGDSNGFTKNWVIRDMTLDGNGQNNLITDSDITSLENTSLGAGVYARRCSNSTIENVEFINITGANALILTGYGDGYASTPEVTGNRVSNCVFRNMANDISGNNLSDHSTIYVGTKNTRVENNRLYATETALDENMAGIEIHSPGCFAEKNVVENYRNGIFVASDHAYGGVSAWVRDNVLRTGTLGIAIWGIGNYFDLIEISGNDIEVDSDSPSDGYEYGIIHGVDSGSIWNPTLQDPTEELLIKNNKISFNGADIENSTATGVQVWHSMDTDIVGNIISNASAEGVAYYCNGAFDMTVDVTQNIINFGMSNTSEYAHTGVLIYTYSDGSIRIGEVAGNSIMFDLLRPGPGAGYGVQAGGDGWLNLTVKNNIYQDVTQYNTVGTPQSGSNIWAEYTAETAPASGLYSRGSVAWEASPAGGATPGWICTSSGSPGTWKAMASLSS